MGFPPYKMSKRSHEVSPPRVPGFVSGLAEPAEMQAYTKHGAWRQFARSFVSQGYFSRNAPKCK